MRMYTENAKAIVAWINVCVIWGTTYLVIRIGVGQMPPMLFAGIRWVIAGVVFIAGLRNVSGQFFQLDSRIAPWT